jgi:hypothetical protein
MLETISVGSVFRKHPPPLICSSSFTGFLGAY